MQDKAIRIRLCDVVMLALLVAPWLASDVRAGAGAGVEAVADAGAHLRAGPCDAARPGWDTEARTAAGTPGPRLFTARPDTLPPPAGVLELPAAEPDGSRPGGSARASGAGALDDAHLAELRGGTDTPWNAPWSDMRLTGSVGNNVASNVATGANIVTDGAFSNASGLPMVIQNSGANVLIQNATIVNVQFR